jgi:hypothetical protein
MDNPTVALGRAQANPNNNNQQDIRQEYQANFKKISGRFTRYLLSCTNSLAN